MKKSGLEPERDDADIAVELSKLQTYDNYIYYFA